MHSKQIIIQCLRTFQTGGGDIRALTSAHMDISKGHSDSNLILPFFPPSVGIKTVADMSVGNYCQMNSFACFIILS